jgi:hypothetical protein
MRRRTTTLIALCAAAGLVLSACGRHRQRRQCEELKERTVHISAGIVEELERLDPGTERTDRSVLEERMRRELDEGSFMDECMELDPEQVECLATASTREEWIACGFDEQVLP